ncbi:MAG TPA: serine/threonine-protein kinase [Pirellulaceae bacterium]|nr:serine/threonine-protein kinase [Pirellulaceae bacterium]
MAPARVIEAGIAQHGPGPCPAEGDLQAFAEGRLTEAASDSIDRHVTQCGRCAETLVRLSDRVPFPLNAKAIAGGTSSNAEAVIREPECMRMQKAAREIPLRFGDQDSHDASQESTDSTRLTTDNPAAKRLDRSPPQGEATQAFLPSTPRAIGRYQVKTLLGEGSYGRVYLAHDPQLDRQVAIKVAKFGPNVRRALIDEFLREAKIAAKLKHPGIVTVYDSGEDEQAGCYIVMEYVEGRSLKRLMADEKVPHDKAADYIAQAAEALAYAHKRDLVHRDIKPANLLVDHDGRIKIADFGLAIFEEEQRKRGNEFAGTLAYCSPEQIRGDVPHLDGRTDIWSLGVILYELLTGRRPFGGSKIADEILHRPAKPPRQIDDTIPPQLETSCLRCLHQQAGDRHSTALDLAEDLNQWRFGSNDSASSRLNKSQSRISGAQPSSESTPRSRTDDGVVDPPGTLRRWMLVASATVLAIASLSVGIVAWQYSRAGNSNIESPEVVAWFPHDRYDAHGFDHQNKCYRFDAFGHALFATDSLTGECSHITACFSTKKWLGFSGVFWNLHMDADGSYRCFCARLGRYDDGRQFKLEVCEFEIGPLPGGWQGVRSEDVLMSEFLPLPQGDRVSLKVRIAESDVARVWVNGEAVLEKPCQLLARNDPTPPSSKVGFCGQLGEITFFSFSAR